MAYTSFWTLTLASLLYGVMAVPSQSMAKDEMATRLMASYMLKNTPITATGGPVTVRLKLNLIDVVKADQATNQIDLVLWNFFTWNDDRLRFGGLPDANISYINFEANRLWMPDIVAYSQTAPVENIYPNIKVQVSKSGDVIYVPSSKLRVSCDLTNLKSASGSECTIKYGSWAFGADEIDLRFSGEPEMDLSTFFAGSKYEIVSNTATRREDVYPCCPEVYISLEYKLTIRAKESG